MEEQQGDHEVIPAGGYFRIKGLDLTNQYRFPAGRNLLRFFYTASVVDGDLIFDFVSARISLRYQAPPPGDPRQEPPRKPERRETPRGPPSPVSRPVSPQRSASGIASHTRLPSGSATMKSRWPQG